MKISLIITVFNEAKTIELLLQALLKQIRQPDEIIITDAGSTDSTVHIITEFQRTYSLPVTVIIQKGNRSVGRNAAIEAAQYDWIAITDAGCIPEPSWLDELERCAMKSRADIVAGNQKGRAKTAFQEAVIPYVLVMQDKIKDGSYLPATRSVLLEKDVWKEVGGFNTKLQWNEDYAFFKQVQKNNYTVTICKNAIVYWLPRNSLYQFFVMLRNFALGDIQAHIVRSKIYFLFFRYVIFLQCLLFFMLTHNYRILTIIIVGIVLYVLWSVQKNIKYVQHGWWWLPVLQITADIAVMMGTLQGLTTRKLK